MDTQPFQYVGKHGTVTGTLSPVTNRSEMMVARTTRILVDRVPGLSVAGTETQTPVGSDAAIQIWRFTNASRIVSVEGLAYPLPGPFASADEILAAWDCFMGDDPGFWQYLGQTVVAMDEPDAPPEAVPDHLLTEEQQNDPNSVSAASTTTASGGKRSRATSNGAKKPGAEKSGTATPGTPSLASTLDGSPVSTP